MLLGTRVIWKVGVRWRTHHYPESIRLANRTPTITYQSVLQMTLLLSIPLGVMNLDDNIMIQIVAFCLAMIIGLEWIGASIVNGLDTSRVPAFGEPSGFAQAIGPVLLNLGFTTVVPSWVNIKVRDHVVAFDWLIGMLIWGGAHRKRP